MAKNKKSEKPAFTITDLPPVEPVTLPPHSIRQRYIQIAALILVAMVLLSVIIDWRYEGRVLPGVRVGKAAVGGMTREEVVKLIDQRAAALDLEGVAVSGRGRTVTVVPTVRASREGFIDSSYDLIRFDSQATADAAVAVGHSGNVAQQWFTGIVFWIRGASLPVRIEVNRAGLEQYLRDNFTDLEQPAYDATVVFKEDVPTIIPEEQGEVFDYAEALDDITERIEWGTSKPVELALVADEPRIVVRDIETALPTLERARHQGVSTFVFSEGEKPEGKKFEGKVDLVPWLSVRRDGSVVSVGFNQKLFETWLDASVRPSIDVAVLEPKFEIKDGKVAAFHGGLSGRSVNAAATRLLWEQQFIEGGVAPLNFVVDTIEPKQKVSDMNDLGITELVAEAWTDFRGSPTNRIRNIHRGAALLDGVLIPPGEPFSVVKALSPITAENGFLPELVIKGDRTVPEVGGGLCQVSTTAFRVALNAGVPVLERSNHSYRVPYYEPPIGMDATIYDPAPDFKFNNDMSHHLLLKTRIEGTRLIYQLWGTKDARTIVMSTPKIWDIVAPPEKQIIETENLKPGEEKCIERAHVGSKASFSYEVTYADGTEKKQEFVSAYKPWRAVCMVGKDPLAPVVPENQNPPPEAEGVE
ncbi:MAG: VanW family protein [bacterium]|nr:VanW family protein [bacterium]